MLNIKHSFILISIITLIATGCKKDDEPSSTDTSKDDKSLSFDAVFGTPDKAQKWKYSDVMNFDVYMPQGTKSLACYYTYFGKIYKAADIESPSQKESIYINVPADVTSVDVLVDWHRYTTDGTTDIDARTDPGEMIPNVWPYYSAQPMAWLLAADSPVNADFDFNDLIARMVPNAAGGVDITALCSGADVDIWLHYTDGSNDYIITPYAPNGMFVKTAEVRTVNSVDYTWQQWFGDPSQGIAFSGLTINVGGNGGIDHREGCTVSLPAEMFPVGFDVESLCVSNTKYEEHVSEYNGTDFGFYVSVGVYDLARKKELSEDADKEPSMAMSQMSIGPMGKPTQIIVIPDLPCPYTDIQSEGWMWPTSGSRIDFVYTDFSVWVSDPKVNWFSAVPGGMPNQAATFDDNYFITNFGYYVR